METPEQLLAKRIAELPQYVKDAIGEANATQKMRDLGVKHKLRIDQQSVMEREVMLVMFGFATEKEFVRNLIAEAHIELSTAEVLAKDIAEDIFAHIRAAMRRMQEEKGGAPATTTPKAVAVAPVPPTPKIVTQKTVPPSASVAGMFKQSTPIPPATAPQGTTEAQSSPLAHVEETLVQTKAAPAQKITLPQKPSASHKDPYREPIE